MKICAFDENKDDSKDEDEQKHNDSTKNITWGFYFPIDSTQTRKLQYDLEDYKLRQIHSVYVVSTDKIDPYIGEFELWTLKIHAENVLLTLDLRLRFDANDALLYYTSNLFSNILLK